MADGQVLIEISADNRDAKQTIKDTTQDLNNATNQWEKSGERLSGVFKKLAAAVSAVKIGQWLVNFGKDAVEAASNLQEVQNVVDVTFGKSSDEINKWAKNAITQFGLTETQAKQFASTMGAMLKSSGIAGDEIVDMSEKLAGLAADMASFYNMDFETAFQKIRSGIAGETEPLKQLGINMSVANLEAFALTQGITKSFEAMSQGEQTMLRYQYMMQATADAQGDFARTSGEYANQTRTLQSNLETLKATVGGPIMETLNKALNLANDLFTALFPDTTPQTTVLDKFAEIDVDTEQKLAEVRVTAETARDLVNLLDKLSSEGYQPTSSVISNLASGANALNSESPSNWFNLLSAFTNESVTGVKDLLNTQGDPQKLQDIANALSGIDGSEDKREAWLTLLQAIGDNADAFALLSNTSADAVKSIVESLADKAKNIDADDAQAWNDLLTAFALYFPDLITSDTLKSLSQTIGGIATNANELSSDSKSNWSTFLNALQQIDGLANIWGGDVRTVQNLADALANPGITPARGAAWEKIITTLKENVGVISEMRNETPEATMAWLEGLATAANTLDPASAAGWDTLFTWLVQGLPGLSETDEGKKLMDAINKGQEPVKEASSEAQKVMEMLGVSTEGVNDQQKLWLQTCRQLVQLIPSLSRIINTETGEILGGAEAVKKYIDAWEEQSVKEIYINALQQKLNELEAAKMAVDSSVKIAAVGVKARAGSSLSHYTQRPTGIGFLDNGQKNSMDTDWALAWINDLAQEAFMYGYSPEQIKDAIRNRRDYGDDISAQAMNNLAGFHTDNTALMAELEGYIDAVWDLYNATYILPTAEEEYKKAIKEATEEGVVSLEELADAYGTLEDSTEGATNAAQELTDEEKKVWQTALQGAIDAAKAIEDYRNQVIKATESTLAGWGDAFAAVESQDQKTLKEIKASITDLTGEAYEAELNIKIGTSDMKSAQNMLANLTNRGLMLKQYEKLINRASELGFSNDVLATLADGSLESYDYLNALVQAEELAQKGNGESYVDRINAAYETFQERQNQLAETLAGYKLTADDEFQGLVDNMTSAMNALDAMLPSDAPGAAVGATLDAVMTAISSRLPGLESLVAEAIAAISSLTEMPGISVSGSHIGHGGGVTAGGFTFTYGVDDGVDGYHASGLDFVPFDGYIGQLHRGEAVLTAQEAQIWREFRNGLDTNSIADAIWNNSPNMGGNVYLNGESVGRIMSAAQADSYRQLERSGWRG